MNEQGADNRQRIDNEEYFDRSGCRPLAITFVVIVVFWVIVGICMFTK